MTLTVFTASLEGQTIDIGSAFDQMQEARSGGDSVQSEHLARLIVKSALQKLGEPISVADQGVTNARLSVTKPEDLLRVLRPANAPAVAEALHVISEALRQPEHNGPIECSLALEFATLAHIVRKKFSTEQPITVKLRTLSDGLLTLQAAIQHNFADAGLRIRYWNAANKLLEAAEGILGTKGELPDLSDKGAKDWAAEALQNCAQLCLTMYDYHKAHTDRGTVFLVRARDWAGRVLTLNEIPVALPAIIRTHLKDAKVEIGNTVGVVAALGIFADIHERRLDVTSTKLYREFVTELTGETEIPSLSAIAFPGGAPENAAA